MTTAQPSIHDDLRSRYGQHDSDVDLRRFLAERAITADEKLAEVIELDGRLRMERGRTAPLQRYLDAVPDLVDHITALDAAIEMVLRSEQRSGRTLAEAVDSLCRRYPGVEPSIRDATALNRLIHSGLFAADGHRAIGPGPTRIDAEAVERAGPPPADAVPGYRLITEIYRGGQGVVYQAIQLSTNRVVAVKVLTGGRFATEREQRRFLREIRLAAGLTHPSIVTIYDSGLHDGRHYCAMEYIDGEPLDHYVGTRELGPEEVLRLFVRIGDAVRYAHDRGVVHRDIKPQNILVDADGVPHLLDFGLAKATTVGRREAETITTEFVGTLAYASPEQLEGDPADMDERTDVYALGLLLFQLLTGRHAYDLGGDFLDVARRIVEDRPPRPSSLRPDINDDLDTIVLRAMAKTRERRYQSVDELLRDVEHVLAGEAIQARHDSPLYLARAHYRTFVQRHVAIASVTMVLVAALAAQGLGALLLRAVPATRFWERTVAAWTASPDRMPSLDPVRVIAFDDTELLAALAAARGLEGVDPAAVRSLRRLHGELMHVLARAGIGVLVFDITFDGSTPYDEDFARGVEAMRAAGIDVVVSTPNWERDDDGNPAVAERIVDAGIVWGCTSGRFQDDEPWRVHLAVEKRDRHPEASLALAAVSSLRHPGAVPLIDLDHGVRSAVVHFSTDPVTNNPRTRVPAEETVSFDLSGAARHPDDDDDLAIGRGDLVATSIFRLHDTRELERRTLDYADVLRMTDAERAAALGGAVVLVGDRRPGVDRYAHHDGRTGISGVYAHASAIGALLDGATIRYPGWESWFLLTATAAIAGLVITRRTGSRRGRRLAALAVGAVAIVVVSAVAFRLWLSLWNPLVPILAMLIGAQLAAVARPLYRTRWR